MVRLKAMVAVLFPGQGSQKPGMGKEVFDTEPVARDVFYNVAEAIGVDTQALCFSMNEEELRLTLNAQLALYTVGVATWAALSHRVGCLGMARFTAAAGHSVGEYAALVASDILSVEEGARLVKVRGELMHRSGSARPGTMAAVFGMSKQEVESICQQTKGTVVVANDNSPGQVVISGEKPAVEEATKALSEKGARRVVPLNVSGAFHSPLMEEPAQGMREPLAQAVFGDRPSRAIYPNVMAEAWQNEPSWPTLLQMQLSHPVRWTETLQRMEADGIELYIECGVGEVLTGLVKRTVQVGSAIAVHCAATLDVAVSRLEGNL